MWSARVRVGAWARLAGVGLVTAAGVIALGAPASAAEATRYVALGGSDENANDCTVAASPCKTIQYAVDQAASGDTVSVGQGTYHEAVHVRKSLTVVGAGSSGSAGTTVNGIGAASDPSIWIDGTAATTTPSVTLRDLDVSGNTVSDGIRDDAAIITVEDSVVSGNRWNGIAVESSVSPPAAVPSATISNVTITENGANASGAGVLVLAGTAGISHSTVAGNGAAGVNVAGGSATIESSTLDANVAAGLLVVNQTGTGRLIDSTVSNTVPFSQQGVADPLGAGVLAMPGANVAVENSTIAGNTGQGILSQSATVVVDNSTIAGTKPAAAGSSGPAAGVAVQSLTAASAVRSAITSFGLKPTSAANVPRAAAPGVNLTGAVVAQQSGVADCVGDVTDQGYNLDDDGSCALSGTGSIDTGSAKLGALSDNGGATQTLVPAKGSQVIDAIPSGSAGCTNGASDQRDVSRPQGPKCDIGAVEVEQDPIVISPGALPDGTVGQKYSVQLTASGGLGAPYVWTLAPDSVLPTGFTLSSAGLLSGTPTKAGSFPFTVSVDDPVLKAYTLHVAAAPPPSTSPPPTSPPATSPPPTAAPPTSPPATSPLVSPPLQSPAAPNSAQTPLANTGSDVFTMTGSGVALLLAGGLLLLAGRIARRRGHHLH